jgi:hypothetical protein
LAFELLQKGVQCVSTPDFVDEGMPESGFERSSSADLALLKGNAYDYSTDNVDWSLSDQARYRKGDYDIIRWGPDIRTSQFVVVLLTDGYFQSEICLQELEGTLQAASQAKDWPPWPLLLPVCPEGINTSEGLRWGQLWQQHLSLKDPLQPGSFSSSSIGDLTDTPKLEAEPRKLAADILTIVQHRLDRLLVSCDDATLPGRLDVEVGTGMRLLAAEEERCFQQGARLSKISTIVAAACLAKE